MAVLIRHVVLTPNGTGITKHPNITIMEAALVDDGAYSPSQSIRLHQRDHIVSLRDACNEALGEEVKP